MNLVILAVFILCAFYVQTRGTQRHKKLKRSITDHANVFGPINCLFYATSKVPTTPYVDPALFPELDVLKERWTEIRDEARVLNAQGAIKASDKPDDIGFNSFFKTGWTRFYLKWYGSSLDSARKLCPETTAMVESIPSVKGAMFAMLPPGARLVTHRDPFAGSLRYHMGLETPNDDDCFIEVDGDRYSWRDGEVVMFDETYLHFAENKTDKDRIVLFLDIRRPVIFRVVDWINTLFSNIVMAASATANMPGDKIGAVNKAFGGIQKVRLLGKKIKAWNKPVYNILQYGLYLLIIWLIFF
ncbi:beta-hydroxylase [Shimia isoporae]|uniref:Beta-hydroxylase n=1 Tax=Shimia isoporae TaxID=647720 RepID=A0A4R1NKE6_9RHOB|nr:aspartyl/asparaginyl beta-hydroxylase domain-containing protein [Shimia isoporae]TCL08109.1 beta-hydroxylase [Shimia isoporae]